MNINDVAEFFDLIKDPKKYEAKLKELKDEQGRLEASIATVVEVGKLDAFKKDLIRRENEVAALEATYNEKVTNENAAIQKQQELVANIREEAEKLRAECNAKKLHLARFSEELEAEKVVVATQRKNVDELVEQNQKRSAELNVLIEDYNTKTAQLKAVMG